MATTDARPGFKLPWSAERTESDATPASDPAPEANAEAPDERDTAPEGAIEAAPAADVPAPSPAPFDPWRLGTNQPAAVVEAPRRKPNKLMAELTRAMQQAAESARDETLERLQADAKAFIESVHARSGTEADDLRRAADEDIAGIREWSKAEIARIREETDQRIADRKVNLDGEIESHAARIEGQIERVQQHVARFEAEMAGFFERLLGEDDPTRLAAMAENLPEPPSFEDDLVDVPASPASAQLVAGGEPAVDATGGAAPSAKLEAAAVLPAEAPGETAAEPAADQPVDAHDARLFALGLTPEAAAEAEAEAELDPATDGDEIAAFSDDALSARLAGLVPTEGETAQAEVRSTRVIVTGLVSVASIASFKRHLGQLEGATAVGVSSGPDGEFVFSVTHVPHLDVPAAIPALPGFQARVTDTTDDTVTVAARDPETAS